MRLGWLVAFLSIVLMNTASTVYAQYGNPNSNVTSDNLEECNTLGIKPEKCSEAEILKHYCLAPMCGSSSKSPPVSPDLGYQLDPVVFSILVGSGVALIAGTLYVRKVRKVRKKE